MGQFKSPIMTLPGPGGSASLSRGGYYMVRASDVRHVDVGRDGSIGVEIRTAQRGWGEWGQPHGRGLRCQVTRISVVFGYFGPFLINSPRGVDR
ncbi:hypothetical protein PanWU01x14_090260 [Parasponia andersonii]|uniref:Uncharacterized protein n=1 Tax=Parasponia andersonii TaxID=3476 RepID=A0A2P5D7M6_PARAD|nr:hypothetical protein PanWU01x14_090260 [Parasponia andersonii]